MRPRGIRHGGLLLAATVVLLLSGCSSLGHRVSGIEAGSTDPLKPTALPAGDQIPVTKAVLLGPGQALGLISMPWVLTGIDSTHQVLRISYVTGDGRGVCVKARGLRVVETNSTVLIAALSKTIRHGACDSSLGVRRSTITLLRPLGQRALVHAEVDKAWERTAPA